MSWAALNNVELQAVRKLLMLDVAEAAECVGNVSVRSWQYWESGERTIPDDVEMEMYGLLALRNEAIDGIISNDEDELPQRWYHTFEEFLVDYPASTKAWWRVHQSVVSYLFCEGGEIELVTTIDCDKSAFIYKYFSRTREEDIEQRMDRLNRSR
jgi:hypothetical protein